MQVSNPVRPGLTLMSVINSCSAAPTRMPRTEVSGCQAGVEAVGGLRLERQLQAPQHTLDMVRHLALVQHSLLQRQQYGSSDASSGLVVLSIDCHKL